MEVARGALRRAVPNLLVGPTTSASPTVEEHDAKLMDVKSWLRPKEDSASPTAATPSKPPSPFWARDERNSI